MIIEEISLREGLLRRWPDLPLIDTYQGLLAIYQALCAEELTGASEAAAYAAYQRLCARLVAGFARDARPGTSEEERVRSQALALRERHADDWLQRLASLLAMLMHFEVDPQVDCLLVNRRRPGKSFSTYPTSPAVARLAAEFLVTSLFAEDVPERCSASEAERYAERTLPFRVLDPSMESGQLLLEIAQAVLRRVARRHRPGTSAYQRLAGALLEKLWHDCLWGIDRSPRARLAVEVLVSLLGAAHGLPRLRPARLLTADALDLLGRGELPRFDGIVNNPPWGEEVSPAERRMLKRNFRTLQDRTDTYVPFSELAIRCLRSDGVFVMILPGQAVTAWNSAGLREMLLEETSLDRIVLLPRAAFGDATVRGLVLAGRAHPIAISRVCRATIYPVVKRMAATSPPRLFEISQDEFRHLGRQSWAPLLMGNGPEAGLAVTVPLGRLAVVAPGVQLYCVGRGIPQQTPEVVRLRPFSLPKPGPGATPAIRGRDVRPFRVMNPSEYVRFGSWLARSGDHDGYRQRRRIFVRELSRRDGRLSAAAARDGFIPLHGVLTVVPTHIAPRVLVGILNSSKAAEYVQAHAASFSKVDFQRITVEELRRMPVPVAALTRTARIKLKLGSPTPQELMLRSELLQVVKALSHEATEAIETVGLRNRLDAVVSALFVEGRKEQ